MSNAKREALSGSGRGAVGETAVVGVRDRATKQIAAKVVEHADASALQGLVVGHATPDVTVYSDDSSTCDSLPFDQDIVKHSLSEYVKGDVYTNGIESLWALLKRAHTGMFHKLSPKHLDRYVQEFAARHNLRDEDTIDIMSAVTGEMRDKRLRYRELIAPNGLSCGTRSAGT